MRRRPGPMLLFHAGICRAFPESRFSRIEAVQIVKREVSVSAGETLESVQKHDTESISRYEINAALYFNELVGLFQQNFMMHVDEGVMLMRVECSL